MNAGNDSHEAPAVDHGSSSSSLGTNCLLCGTDLGLDWPDLSKLVPADIRDHAPDDWRRAAHSGCPFCNVVVSVVDDARKQHGCFVAGLPFRNWEVNYNGFQVFLGPNESTGQYLLALEHVWMPLLVEPGEEQNEFWGIITVYLDETDGFNTHLEPFFEIPRQAASTQALGNIRNWLTTCQNTHPDCSRSLQSDEGIPAPSNSWVRILEICQEKLRLSTMMLGDVLPPYVALSHCWGSCPTLKTLSTNIERFRIGINLRDLPSTFEDAITMAKSLGFGYIWIDSLCIVQDSPADWEEQSSLMAFVYGNADLVLAASSASSTEDGFLKERKGYRESNLQVPAIRNHKNTLNLKYRLLQMKDLAPMLDPLDRRSWALQERLLARRYLAIGSHESSWICTTSSACECEWWRVASFWRYEIVNTKKLVQHASEEDLGRCWRNNVLRHYFTRKLTVPSDNLVALSAIASIFQRKSGSNYYAGIWQHDLIPGLLWNCVDPRPGYASNYYSAPSWSWASLPNLDFNVHMKSSDSPPGEALVRVLEANTMPSTVNQFGSVCSGFIKLRGRMWRTEVTASELASKSRRLQLLIVEGYFVNTFTLMFDTSLMMVEVCLSDGADEKSLRRVRREEVQDSFYIGNVQESERITLSMIPLLEERYYSSEDNLTFGLILGRSPQEPTKFERIGVFHTRKLTAVDPSQHKEGGPDDYTEQELIII